VPDLGIDKVMIYAFDEVTGKLSPAKQPLHSQPQDQGPGFLFSSLRKYAYLIEEIREQ
jgi:6-phosphogluconolactonase